MSELYVYSSDSDNENYNNSLVEIELKSISKTPNFLERLLSKNTKNKKKILKLLSSSNKYHTI